MEYNRIGQGSQVRGKTSKLTKNGTPE